MPTYEYLCTDCGEPLEAVQSFTDDALTICPHCGGKLRKVFSPVGVVFKGSGFYRTDSRSNGKPKTGDSADRGDSGGDSKGSDAKAADSKTGDGKSSESKSSEHKSSETKKSDAKSGSGNDSGAGSKKPAPAKTGSGSSNSSS